MPLLYMPRLCGPDSAMWPDFSSTQVLLKAGFGVMYLVPELIRTKHAALCLHLRIKMQQKSQGNKGALQEKPVLYESSCWLCSVTLWYHPFSSCGEHVLCLVHLQMKSSVSKHGTYRTSLTYYNLMCHWRQNRLYQVASRNRQQTSEPMCTSRGQAFLIFFFLCSESVSISWWLFSFLLRRH